MATVILRPIDLMRHLAVTFSTHYTVALAYMFFRTHHDPPDTYFPVLLNNNNNQGCTSLNLIQARYPHFLRNAFGDHSSNKSQLTKDK